MSKKIKIGVLGTSYSGKTVLLTSLLWHLRNFTGDTFRLGKETKAEIKNFTLEFDDENKCFPFEAYSNAYVTNGKWPSKTQDYAIARCTYYRTDFGSKRDVTFVDIPGERVSDVFIWKARDYADWCNQIINHFWTTDNDIEECMSGFKDSYK